MWLKKTGRLILSGGGADRIFCNMKKVAERRLFKEDFLDYHVRLCLFFQYKQTCIFRIDKFEVENFKINVALTLFQV